MVDPSFVGRTFVAEPFEVSAVKIREFARATRATHPAHYDRAAAQALGAPDLIAPLTFVVSPAQAAEKLYLDEPGSGVDFTRIVHGGEEFGYFRPVVAGDVLTASYTVESIKQTRALTIIVGRCSIQDADGQLVATAVSTMVQRGEV